jgi:ABC-2 type transport system permease protein
MGQSTPMSVDEWVVRNVLGNSNVIFLFVIPILTMRSFAEEKRTGTMELLATSPLRDSEIILGKWLGALAMFTTLIALMAVNLVTLYAYGTPDWRPMLAGFLGLWLEGGALLAIGIFISSTTRNQIVAASASFFTLLLLYILDWATQFDSSPVTKVIAYLAVVSHFEPFTRGVIDTKDVVYYITMIALGLFLTARSMDSMRWRA